MVRDRLIAALWKHHELIPHSTVPGRAMGFHDPNGSGVVGPYRVTAYFEDGHRDGRPLLANRIDPESRIGRRLLDS